MCPSATTEGAPGSWRGATYQTVTRPKLCFLATSTNSTNMIKLGGERGRPQSSLGPSSGFMD